MDLVQLKLAARSAGLPLDWRDRVSSVQQPAVVPAIMSKFFTMLSRMSLAFSAPSNASLPMAYMLNPSGQAWLLLAFPDRTEADAIRMFEVAGDAGGFRIALAGPEYEGVAVLARVLMGPAPVVASSGAVVFETIFWEEPCAKVDPRKWSVGCFKSSDQLLPVFLVSISTALHSDMQAEVMRLGRQNSLLHSQRKIRNGIERRAREANRSRLRREGKREENDVMGHKRVRVAESQQPETNLLSIDFKSDETEDDETPMAEAMDSCITVSRTRGAGTPGEIAVESIVVKLPGFKRKRNNADGTRPGGLEWDNSVLLNAILLYTLSHTSLKEAGSAGLSFLSRHALEVYVKAQPLYGHQSRRIDGEKPLPLFKPISATTVRAGTAAFELAKNDAMIDFFSECHVINGGHDGSSVGTWSFQCLFLRGLRRVTRFLDGAGTRKLGAEARSMCMDMRGCGDKFQTQFLVTGEDGTQRRTSISAPANLGAQLHQAGMWHQCV